MIGRVSPPASNSNRAYQCYTSGGYPHGENNTRSALAALRTRLVGRRCIKCGTVRPGANVRGHLCGFEWERERETIPVLALTSPILLCCLGRPRAGRLIGLTGAE